MTARNKPPVRVGPGLNIRARGQNRRNAVHVHVSYRAVLRGWAFRPYYGWESGYSTDRATVNATLASNISTIQQITSADGTIPVIAGEYGNSTDGVNVDANGNQVLAAVQQAASDGELAGSAAWMYASGNADALLNGSGGLSSFGQEVSDYIGTTPACAQSPVPTASATNSTSAVTAPALAAASTAVTAPPLPTSASAVTAPTLTPNRLSIGQVAAMAVGGS